jgi:hypothetical protein
MVAIELTHRITVGRRMKNKMQNEIQANLERKKSQRKE